MKTSMKLLVSALAVHQAAATWGSGDHYNCPANTDNKCNDSQKNGWNWHDLPEGDFDNYGGHNFSGFKCASGNQKRDGLAKRWGDKCIAGQAGPGSGPSVSCGDDHDGFSINHMHVQAEHDQDFEFHYKMGDGSTCKQVSPCRAGGNIIENNQCGGAKTVSIQLPTHAPKPCSISVYSVGFDCSTASPPAPPSYTNTPPTLPPYPSTTTTTTTSSSTTPPYTPPPKTYPTPSESTSSSTSSSSTTHSTPYSPVTTSSSSTSSSTSESSTSCSTSSHSTPESPTTSSTTSSTPYSPVTHSSSSTTPYHSVPLTTAPPSSHSSSTTTTSSTTPYVPVPSGNCPGTLPKCLNSWMWQTGCKDNGDYECYCKQPDFASKVCGCITAYGADDDEIAKGIDYFQGICQRYVGENYGLALKCNKPKPSSSHSTPYSPVSTSSSSSVSTSTTTSTTETTDTVTTYPSGHTVTSGTVTSTLTKPVTSTVYKTTTTSMTYPETQTTVITTQYVTTCPIGHPVTSGTVTTTLTTPSISTVYSTTTSTICTKCSAPPPTYTSSTPSAPVYTGPVTTITVHKTYTVPCTYSTGESVGLTIPKSSTHTVVSSSYTVPQVVITHGAGTSSGGLAYGPAPTPAYTTPAGPAYTNTGFGTSYVPKPTSQSTAPPPFNAAPVNKVSAGSLGALILAAALMAL